MSFGRGGGTDAGEVLKRLRAALEHEPRVNLHRDRVDVELSAGVATLSGEVADIAAKRLTLEAAAALPGIVGIVDRLHVRPAERMGDAEIADHIAAALLADSTFAEFAIRRRMGASVRELRPAAHERTPPWIEISVVEGVVTLDGDVPSLSHKRLAGAMAWWVPGSRDVVNGLGVEPDEEDTDAEILDALRVVLEKDPFLDATQMRASCTNAIVTLEGLVANEAYRKMAEFDAWAVFGVDKVLNRIEVGPV
jgi:osmotically-inducible protein OsmY